MTNEAVGFLSAYFNKIMLYFTSWKFPGTNVTPAVFIFGSFCIVYFWRLLLRILNSNDGGGSKE